MELTNSNTLNWLQPPTPGILFLLTPQCCDHRYVTLDLTVYIGAGGPNSGPQVCVTRTLSTKPFPQPHQVILQCAKGLKIGMVKDFPHTCCQHLPSLLVFMEITFIR